MNKVTFGRQAFFFNELKSSVEEYFKQNKIRSTGNFKLYLKGIILGASAIALYTILVFFTPSSGWLALTLAGLMGFVMAGIGFNIMHDACHGSFSSRKWVNDLLGLSMNAMGSVDFLWKIKHNIIHHTYTNVDGLDDDIFTEPFIRHCESQPYHKLHRFQHLYAIPLYSITTLYWMLYNDFTKYFSGKIHNTPLRKLTLKEHFAFWGTKLLYVAVYMGLPVLMVGWAKFLLGFVVMHLVCGLTVAVVFQLAHVVEETKFIEVNTGSKKVEEEWAVFQVNTTANFATDNKVITWFLGGLNFQVEHHLFPRISHVHYPAINKLLIEACEKFNVQYNHFPTMLQAVQSHHKQLKQMGIAS